MQVLAEPLASNPQLDGPFGGLDFLPLAAEIPIRTEVTTYSLEQTSQALDDLRNGRFTGSAVVVP